MEFFLGQLLFPSISEPLLMMEEVELIGIDADKSEISSARLRLEQLRYRIDGRLSGPSVRIILIQRPVSAIPAMNIFFDGLSAIEIIEHLAPDELEAFPELFRYSSDFLSKATVTTPNSEYNLFLPCGPTRFRHPDHKFEWTRAEFRHWCRSHLVDPNIACHCQFEQIGILPGKGSMSATGGCSQAFTISLQLKKARIPPFIPPADAFTFHFKSKKLADRERSFLISMLKPLVYKKEAVLLSDAVIQLNCLRYSEEFITDAIARSDELDLTMDGKSFYEVCKNFN